MVKIVTTLVLILSLIAGSAAAREGAFGLGVIAGEPTGISGKLWLSNRTAIDGALAWSFERNARFQIHGDFLVHEFDLISVEKGVMPFYYGIGGRIKLWEDNRDENVGVRFPVGLAYLFATVRLDMFVEVVPILDLAPETDLEMNAAIGLRYYFSSTKAANGPRSIRKK